MQILGTRRIKRLIIYGQLFVLLSAFASIYWQVHGLFGERGLVPVAPKLECDEKSVFQCPLPLLRFICNVLHFSPSVGIQFIAISGVMLSGLAIYHRGSQNVLMFFALYFMYQTIYEAGGVFMYYQWDALLLESTIYVGILAWFEDGPGDSIALYGITVLACRVLFMTGSSKLLSRCPKWWSLTALDYHFESQPLPTPFAWYAHHFPPFIKQLATLLTAYIEVILPPIFLTPLIHVRYFMFFTQVLVVTVGTLTGNFGCFNFNIIVLLISLLDSPQLPFGNELLSVVIFAKISYDFCYLGPWQMTVVNRIPSLSLNFSFEAFNDYLAYYIDVIVVIITITFIAVIGYAYVTSLPFDNRIRRTSHFIFVITSITFLLIYGLVPFLRLDQKVSRRATPSIMHYYKVAERWNLVNSYGSYRHMTGTYGRPEIIIEGSHHIEGPWREIEFYAKPGRLDRRPRFVAPHMPRLDWQMYYAAEGTYQQNPFFLSLVYHLMQNTTEVVNLIEKFPFKNRSEPMNFVRAKLYMYHFTKVGEKGWWTRDFQEEYMPTFNKGNNALLDYLKENKIIYKPKNPYVNGPLGKALKQGHRITSGIDHLVFVAAIILTVILMKIHHLYFDPDHAHDDELNEEEEEVINPYARPPDTDEEDFE